MNKLQTFGRAWKGCRAFQALPLEEKTFVFYAEDESSWGHLEPILKHLTEALDRRACYLTSSVSDPVLVDAPKNVRSFFIGEGALRTFVFQTLQAGVAVMTMPDLHSFHLKRSMTCPVKYVYVFHSPVSSHMIYRREAFHHYDTILCVGPHHIKELRKAEELYGLPKKHLVEHGYGRIETLMAEAPRENPSFSGSPLRVLIAPSWGQHGLLETCGVRLIQNLLEQGVRTTVRPHPMTLKKHPGVVAEIRERFAGREGFELETAITSANSLHRADVMVSDWSGVAMEFAFAFLRPVVFIDVPRKVNNPWYEELAIEPVEVGIRRQIGEILSVDKISEAASVVNAVAASSPEYKARIQEARRAHLFNLGSSGAVGASYLASLVDGAVKRSAI